MTKKKESLKKNQDKTVDVEARNISEDEEKLEFAKKQKEIHENKTYIKSYGYKCR